MSEPQKKHSSIMDGLRLCAVTVKSLHTRFRAAITKKAQAAVPKGSPELLPAAELLLLEAERTRTEIPAKKLKAITAEGMTALAKETRNLPKTSALFTPEQRAQIAAAAKNRKEADAVRDIFGDHDRLYYRAHKTLATSETEAQVTALLGQKGYRVADYDEGYATDAGGKQQLKIGKLLRDDARLLEAFNEDRTRGSSGLLVVFSRNAEDIARMSTGRAWRSCMAADRENFHFVPRDIASGTIAAYLISENDPEINDPVARMLIKPYLSPRFGDAALRRNLMSGALLDFMPAGVRLFEKFQSAAIRAFQRVTEPFAPRRKTLMVPEETLYGIDNHDFVETVRIFAEEKFNKDREGLFGLTPGLYEDGRGSVVRKTGAKLETVEM